MSETYSDQSRGKFNINATNSSWMAEFDSNLAEHDNNLPHLKLLSEIGSVQYAASEKQIVAVIFKGVLYNRSDLARANHLFDKNDWSDVEFLLNLYLATGSNIIGQLRGIYNILIWDANQKRLFCSRDPLGFEPLFYGIVQSKYVFSNSIATLLQYPGLNREINRPALADYLSRRWPLYDETYYLAIKRVMVGHYILIQDNLLENHQYWDPSPPGTPDDTMSEADFEEFEDYLEQAVGRCLRFGKSGIFLSGGLDSVSIAAVASDLCRKNNFPDPLALSLVFPDPGINEEDIQKRVASGLGIEQILIPFDEAVGEMGLISGTLSFTGNFPQPIQNPWRIAYNNLAQRGVDKDCEVILTGIGGDDWLTVNPGYIADLIKNLDVSGSFTFINALRRSFNAPTIPVIRYMLWTIGLRPIIASSGRKTFNRLMPSSFYNYRFKRISRVKETPEWIAPDPQLRQQLDLRTNQTIDELLKRPEPSGPYGFYKHDARSTTFSHPMLTLELEEDFEAGKLLGIKLLHPFWDADLIQYLCRIPPRLLLKGGHDKGIVRQTIARRFPNIGFDRQKKVIAGSFIKNTLILEGMEAFKRIGGLQYLIKFGIIQNINDNFIEKLLIDKDLNENHRVWELLTLEAWLRSHG
jgi:asparagine synthetase B (glutamine-hydrolysing)